MQVIALVAVLNFKAPLLHEVGAHRDVLGVEIGSWIRIWAILITLFPAHDEPVFGKSGIPLIHNLTMPAARLSSFSSSEALPIHPISHLKVTIDVDLTTGTRHSSFSSLDYLPSILRRLYIAI